MKTLKMVKLAALLSMITVGYSSRAALDVTDISTEFEKPKSYQESNIGFEFENDTKKPVWIIVDNKKSDESVIEVPPTGFLNEIRGANTIQKQTDISGQTRLLVWYQNPGNVTIKKPFFDIFGSRQIQLLGPLGTTKIQPEPDVVYTFTPGKTVYVTLDKYENLVPSKIIKGSIATETGLSLENNVIEGDIQIISKKQK